MKYNIISCNSFYGGLVTNIRIIYSSGEGIKFNTFPLNIEYQQADYTDFIDNLIKNHKDTESELDLTDVNYLKAALLKDEYESLKAYIRESKINSLYD
jgi:uncharacterized iron-regulated protein